MCVYVSVHTLLETSSMWTLKAWAEWEHPGVGQSGKLGGSQAHTCQEVGVCQGHKEKYQKDGPGRQIP